MLGCKNFVSDIKPLKQFTISLLPQRRDLCQVSWGFYPSYTRNMAPRMGPYQHALIEDLLRLGATRAEYASTAGYTVRSITSIKKNLRVFRSTLAPPNCKSGQFLLNNQIIIVILLQLKEKPTLFSNKLQ